MPNGNPFQRTFLYAASSTALERWSVELGFRIVHIGIANDVLSRVAALRGLRHANLSYFVRPFERDLGDGDWWCVPVSLGLVDSGSAPASCTSWGGAVAVDLPRGVDPGDLALRLALLMRPLEAHLCAQLPSVMEAHVMRSMFQPVMPRYSEGSRGRFLAQDLYKLSDAADEDYLHHSLHAALASFGAGRELVDLVVNTLRAAPSAAELSSTSY